MTMLRLSHLSRQFVRAQPCIIGRSNRRLATTPRLHRQETAALQGAPEVPITEVIVPHQAQAPKNPKRPRRTEKAPGQQSQAAKVSEPDSKEAKESERQHKNGKKESGQQDKAEEAAPDSTAAAKGLKRKARASPKKKPIKKKAKAALKATKAAPPKKPALKIAGKLQASPIIASSNPRRKRLQIPDKALPPVKPAPHHELLFSKDSISLPEYIDIVDAAGPNAVGRELADPVFLTWKRMMRKDSSTTKSETQPESSSTERVTSDKDSKKHKLAQSIHIETIEPSKMSLLPVEQMDLNEVPLLQYDLDRVLFQCGVQQVQDERTGVFNFDPYLATIMPAEEFDFDALKEYITSSKDDKLRGLAAKHGAKYCGSTSSMTGLLSHFHYLLSSWRSLNFGNVSRSVSLDSENFTVITRGPSAAYLAYKDGVYAIDADKQFDTENILSMLGKSMEKLLTLPKDDYEKYRRTKSHTLPPELRNASETYHYSKMGDLLMRSQLDARDPRLPGSGIFDLKTRAVVSIRMDVRGYEKGVGYEIRRQFGQWQSFEREYYDLIRAAFLKYSLQVRMGRMDGIFVAFHNTRRIFGFQYFSRSEMDFAIHGTHDTRLGDQEFYCSVKMLNHVINLATERFPNRTLRLHVETRPTQQPILYFFAEPISDEQMRKNQESGKPIVQTLENEIKGMAAAEEAPTENSNSAESMSRTCEGQESDDSEELESIEAFEKTIKEALHNQDKQASGSKAEKAAADEDVPELLGLSVTLRNYVNGSFVPRPVIEEENCQFDWKVQYAVTELSNEEAQTIYKAIKVRRRTIFDKSPGEQARSWHIMFKGQLRLMSMEGLRHRKRMSKLYSKQAVRVAWDKEPLDPKKVSQPLSLFKIPLFNPASPSGAAFMSRTRPGAAKPAQVSESTAEETAVDTENNA